MYQFLLSKRNEITKIKVKKKDVEESDKTDTYVMKTTILKPQNEVVVVEGKGAGTVQHTKQHRERRGGNSLLNFGSGLMIRKMTGLSTGQSLID